MPTIRHSTGTDVDRALIEFGTHRELPANRRSAAEAIARHAAARSTTVAEVWWEEYDDPDRIRAVHVRFEDGSKAMVSWGWVYHYVTEVPGAESNDEGGWNTWLPENRRQGSRQSDIEARTGECPCNPGLRVPVGSTCGYCEQVVVARMR